MTAPSLRGNFSKFGAYYRYKLRSMRTLTILNCIFALLSYPTVMFILNLYSRNEIRIQEFYSIQNYYELPEYLGLRAKADVLESLMGTSFVIGIIMLAAMFLMNYVFVSKAFRWLYKKSVVDMDYSLPVSDDTRFLGDLLASLTGSLAPHLGAIAIGSGLYWTLPFDASEAKPDEISLVFGIAMQLVFTGVVACIMFMGICLLVMSCCGRVVESRIMPFVANAVIPVIHLVAVINLTQGIYGFGYNSDYEFMGLGATSPLGLLATTLMSVFNSGDIVGFRVPMLRPEIMIPLLIITIGSFAGAYFLIRFRRAERVGSPYVYSGFKLVMPSAVIFTIVALFMVALLPDSGKLGELNGSYVSGPFTAMVIITFIIYIIMELISGKGFAKFHKTALRYAVTMAVSVAICLVLYLSQGMGLAGLVPDAEDVASAEYSFSRSYIYGNVAEMNDIEVVSEEEIAKLIEIHKAVPKKNRNLENRYRFSVEYNLASGSTIHRSYNITEEEYEAAFKKMLTPEIFLEDQLNDSTSWIFGSYDPRTYEEYRIISIHSDNSAVVVNMPMEKLVDALRKDSELVSYELLEDDSFRRMDLNFNMTYIDDDGENSFRSYMTLWSWQENTFDLIKEYSGVDIIGDGFPEEKGMILRLPVSCLSQGGNAPEKVYLGNISTERGVENLLVYHGDFGYTVEGESGMIPAGSFDMVEAGYYYDNMIAFSQSLMPDESYSREYVFMLVYFNSADIDESSVLTVDMDGRHFVGDEYYYYDDAERAFDEISRVSDN